MLSGDFIKIGCILSGLIRREEYRRHIHTEKEFKMMKSLLIAVNGFLMALADSVPGVSGGTIAFLMGIYDDFIGSLSDIFGRDGEKRKKAFIFLIKLGIGWVIGLAGAVTVLSALFNDKIYLVSSVFLGFIVFSLPIVIREEKETLKKGLKVSFFTLFGITLVVLLTVFNNNTGMDLSDPSAPEYLFVTFCGMAAISAMVLPGISGSTIMLICGVYVPIITAVKDLLHLDFSGLKIIIPMGIGIVLGVFLIIRLLKAALEKHRGAMIYFIIGMMIGSLYAIVRGPESLDEPRPAMTLGTFSIIGFLFGALIIVGLQFFKSKSEKVKKLHDERADG